MNVANENHRLGASWLARHLEGKFKIITISITDHHIDGMIMPLAPGKLLINPITMKDKIHLLPKELQKWDLIYFTDEENSTYDADVVTLASSNISVNVLPLDDKNTLVFSSTGEAPPSLAKALKNHGINPIPIRLRHSKVFDGGLHCATLDMVRVDSHDDFLGAT